MARAMDQQLIDQDLAAGPGSVIAAHAGLLRIGDQWSEVSGQGISGVKHYPDH
jgi:hypothetical protein